jgi:hypothetical protein
VKARRVAFGVVGLALFLVAWALGDLAALAPVDQAVSLAGNDFFLMVALAVGGVVVALVAVLSGREGALDETEFRDPEFPLDLPRAGRGFDDVVDPRTACLPVVGDADRDAVRSRLRRAAVETLARKTDASRDGAEAMVATGDWTDDPHAAAFLADDARPPASCLLRAWTAGRAWFQVGARRTAREVVTYSDVQGGER